MWSLGVLLKFTMLSRKLHIEKCDTGLFIDLTVFTNSGLHLHIVC